MAEILPYVVAIAHQSHQLFQSQTEDCCWLPVWQLTRIDFGGCIHEVGVRGSISQMCSQVCKISVLYVPSENAPDVRFVDPNQKPTFHYCRCSAPQMLGLVPKLQCSI